MGGFSQNTMKKRCSKCLEKKDRNQNFQKNRAYTDGFSTQCKLCISISNTKRRHKVILANKGMCARPGCENRLGLWQKKYCSMHCYNKANSKSKWQEQKAQPGYKEYHREIAKKWYWKNKHKAYEATI